MDFSKYLFRASSIGKLMVEPRSKSEEISETTKDYLTDCHISARYGREQDISNKYIEKGLAVEADGITLYSRLKKKFYKKNERTLSNLFIKGTPDLFEGLEVSEADIIIDIKCSWDIFTFSRIRHKKINPIYYWQMQAYMALTGAKKANLAYCLINTPEVLISDEKRKLMWKMGCATTESPLYIAACEELENAMTFDDIPMKERMIEFHIERDDSEIEKIYGKVKKAREFIEELDKKVDPSILLAAYDSDVNQL